MEDQPPIIQQPSAHSESAVGPAIHLATPENIHRVVPVFDMYRQWYGMPADLSRAESFLVQRMINSESTLFFAEVNEQIAAFVQLYPTFSSISMDAVWVLNDLFVRPEFRRQGIATLLMQIAAEFACGIGVLRLELETGTGNHTAQELYTKLGWQRQTQFERFSLELSG